MFLIPFLICCFPRTSCFVLLTEPTVWNFSRCSGKKRVVQPQAVWPKIPAELPSSFPGSDCPQNHWVAQEISQAGELGGGLPPAFFHFREGQGLQPCKRPGSWKRGCNYRLALPCQAGPRGRLSTAWKTLLST